MTAGLLPDGRHFASRARDEAADWRAFYKTPIPVASLADRMGAYVQAYTLYNSVRPFGVTAILGGWDSEAPARVDGEVGSGPAAATGGIADANKPADGTTDGSKPDTDAPRRGGPALYMIEPSGLYWGYYGAATGKGRQAAKAELEKLNLHDGTLSLEQGVREAARIIHVAHDDNKDKDFELEMSWISALDGPTRGMHQEVPEELRREAERLAKKALEGEDEDEDAAAPAGGAAAGGEANADRMEE